MRNRLLMIPVMLTVLVAMTGIGGAYTTATPSNIEIDINPPNPETIVTVTYDPEGGALPTDGLKFTIRDGEFSGVGNLATEITGSQNGGSSYVGNNGILPPVSEIGGKYSWTFYVKDAVDSDDATQLGKKYNVVFEVLGTTGIASYTITSSPTIATAIPEFPTVALPIAAVIGLVFLFQNKKKKE
ncbi:MAG: PEF-CTERM sorting domain-containing protein [Candidatus Methanoperedens sp.]|nr:PEF-CTERM sorting domain-containing protein [Candidatus Methanoperedens sp.]